METHFLFFISQFWLFTHNCLLFLKFWEELTMAKYKLKFFSQKSKLRDNWAGNIYNFEFIFCSSVFIAELRETKSKLWDSKVYYFLFIHVYSMVKTVFIHVRLIKGNYYCISVTVYNKQYWSFNPFINFMCVSSCKWLMMHGQIFSTPKIRVDLEEKHN